MDALSRDDTAAVAVTRAVRMGASNPRFFFAEGWCVVTDGGLVVLRVWAGT